MVIQQGIRALEIMAFFWTSRIYRGDLPKLKMLGFQ